MIVIGGMIGLGKSSIAKMLGDTLGSKVFYESVENNKILPLFYTASDAEIQKNRYPFLLQLEFLQSRYGDIKEAQKDKHNVLDRSIHEDWYFALVNKELGRISDLEFEVYENLLSNMMEEWNDVNQKSPDLFIYLRASFETVMYRIGLRGRDFEKDESLVQYYYKLWSGYDAWLSEHYNNSEVLILDMDKYDVVHDEMNANEVLNIIKDKMKEIGLY